MTVKIDGSNGLLQNYDFQTPTTGFSYTFTNFNVLFANPAGTLATGTVTMSATPVDGTTVTITSTQQITALTINANTGQSIVAGGVVQLNANTSRQYLYRAANTTWYLINVAAGAVVTSYNGFTGAVTSPVVDVQTFDTTTAWTKPTGGQTMARVQVWGGGGGGGRAAININTGGGGGGGYNEVTFPLSYIASQTVTVGGGGAGATATGAGGVGGFSSVTLTTAWNGQTVWSAYGGGGGGASSSYGGGGGGGQLGAGTVGGTAINAGRGGLPAIAGGVASNNGGYQGDQVANFQGCSFGINIGPTNIMHGGGGGNLLSPNRSGTGGTGQGSIYGGGGGGGTNNGSAGGPSIYGGAGGNCANPPTAGTAPAGGGGSSGTANINGAAGAAGRIIITCW